MPLCKMILARGLLNAPTTQHLSHSSANFGHIANACLETVEEPSLTVRWKIRSCSAGLSFPELPPSRFDCGSHYSENSSPEDEYGWSGETCQYQQYYACDCCEDTSEPHGSSVHHDSSNNSAESEQRLEP